MIAVTGATGLLGNFIVRKLIDEGQHIVAFKRKHSNTDNLKSVSDHIDWREVDLLDPAALQDNLTGVSGIIHAAAVVSYNRKMRKAIITTNVESTRNIVNACIELNIARLFHISSVAALGSTRTTGIINERNQWNTDPAHSTYAESKYLSELEVFRAQEEGIQTTIINPSLILSPTQWGRSSGKLFKYIHQENPFYIEGLLNYVDARDVAEIIYRLYSQPQKGERFIVNAGNVSILEFMTRAAKFMNKKPPRIKVSKGLIKLLANFEFLSLGNEPLVTREMANLINNRLYFDNDKVKRVLNFEFKSLDDTLQWCCSSHTTPEKQILED